MPRSKKASEYGLTLHGVGRHDACLSCLRHPILRAPASGYGSSSSSWSSEGRQSILLRSRAKSHLAPKEVIPLKGDKRRGNRDRSHQPIFSARVKDSKAAQAGALGLTNSGPRFHASSQKGNQEPWAEAPASTADVPPSSRKLDLALRTTHESVDALLSGWTWYRIQVDAGDPGPKNGVWR